MIAVLIATAAAAQPLAIDVGYEHLVNGQAAAAISAIEADTVDSRDPAELFNLGVAYARTGDRTKARSLFERAYRARHWVELETTDGAWVDSRVLARRALTMLGSRDRDRESRFARK